MMSDDDDDEMHDLMWCDERDDAGYSIINDPPSHPPPIRRTVQYTT